MTEKEFKIKKNQLKRIISTDLGTGIASDDIMVSGKPVKVMERMELINDHEKFSGWVFMSGEESQEFLDSPLNSGVYNLNTIANYDKSIIPHLDKPVGTVVNLTK